jgi:hypothetical protein
MCCLGRVLVRVSWCVSLGVGDWGMCMCLGASLRWCFVLLSAPTNLHRLLPVTVCHGSDERPSHEWHRQRHRPQGLAAVDRRRGPCGHHPRGQPSHRTCTHVPTQSHTVPHSPTQSQCRDMLTFFAVSALCGAPRGKCSTTHMHALVSSRGSHRVCHPTPASPTYIRQCFPPSLLPELF